MRTASLLRITLSVLACLLGAHHVAAQQAANQPAAPGYEKIVERLRTAIRREIEQKQLPAFSICLVDDQQLVWAEGFGFQDKNKSQPATARTVYRVGSVSKLFTDIAVMQQVEQGKLSLDEPIVRYLPDFKPQDADAAKITLRQLMSHRSGLVRESPVGNYFDPTEPSLRETVVSLNDTKLTYRPGVKTKYSNAGIAAVGCVLERQQERPFAEIVADAVIKPLQMKDSSFSLTPSVDKQLATAWMWTYDGRRFEAPRFALGTSPAGNLYSNVFDLAKFISVIFQDGRGPAGALLKPDMLALMMTPQKDQDGKPLRFGVGFHVGELDGHKMIGHGGAVYGFSTQLEVLPEQKLGVAAATSLDGANGVVRRLTDYALRLLLAKKSGSPLPNLPGTSPAPLSRAQELVGTYRQQDKRIELTLDNETLFLRKGSYRYEVRAQGDGFVVDDVLGHGIKITRSGANDITVDGAVYSRKEDARPEAAPKNWKGLIGEYGWDHNTLYILEDRGQLYALVEWFYYYPLEELSPDEFAFPNFGLYHGEKLMFTRGDDGNATQVVAAEVVFKRRSVGTRDGETFRIEPVRPIAELRDAALAARPPAEPGEFRKPNLVELTSVDPTIKLDIRYATTNNFTGARFYQQPRAFMQQPAAEAVARAHQRLKPHGLGLMIHDAYRPWHVTKMFWDATPTELKDFVANPANGSRHNRGCAVDLTLYDLKSGKPIQMVAGYDEFSPRSFPNYPGGTARQRWYRSLLRSTMEAEGFSIYEFEWWHFDFQDWKKYRIQNRTFEELLAK